MKSRINSQSVETTHSQRVTMLLPLKQGKPVMKEPMLTISLKIREAMNTTHLGIATTFMFSVIKVLTKDCGEFRGARQGYLQ